MTEVEKNWELVREYKKKSYEELNELESRPNQTRLEMITIAVAKVEKEEEDGICTGTPAREFFDKLYEEMNEEENSIRRQSGKRSVAY